MKSEKKFYWKLMLSLFGVAALAILLQFFLTHLNQVGGFLQTVVGILMPFIVGAVIAYLLKPLCNSLEEGLQKLLKNKKKGAGLARGLSVVLSLLLAAIVIFTLLIIVVPSLARSIYTILLQIPGSLQRFQNWALELAGDNETLQNYINELVAAVSTNLPDWLRNTVLPRMQTLIGGISAGVAGIFGALYNFLIGVIVSVYLLGSRKNFARQGKKAAL